MICVYPADCTDFSTNGNGTIEPTSALVTETLNHRADFRTGDRNPEWRIRTAAGSSH